MAESMGLKLTKYVEEAANSLIECRLKTAADVAGVVELVCSLHHRYEAFRGAFLAALEREMAVPEPATEDRPAWLNRQRQLLRLTAELLLVAFIVDNSIIYKTLQKLLPEDETNGPLHVPVAISFVKNLGAYFFPSNLFDRGGGGGGGGGREEDEKVFVSIEWRDKFRALLTSFFKAMCRFLVRNHSKLRTLEAKGRQFYETKGDLSAAQTTLLQTTADTVERLRVNLQSLAEQLDLSLPQLDEIETPKMVEGKVVFADLSLLKSDAKVSPIFDSEEERSFYEDILGLRDRVPEVLLSSRSSTIDSPKLGPVQERSASPASTGRLTEEDEEIDLNAVADVDPESIKKSPSSEGDSLVGEDGKSAASITAFFERLGQMQSRSLVDQLAIDFCYINGKSMRKRLSDALLELPIRRLDLLPFIARLLATLKPYFPEIASDVCDSLVGQFIFLFHRKGQPILGTRARICRFLGELVKFRVMPQTTVYAMLKKTILDDLSGYNVEMTALLLETCGRFLFNQPESHRRLLHLFEIVNKKIRTQGLEMSQIVQLENAIYISNPPDRPALVKPPKSPRLAYLYKLIRSDLNETNADLVFRQIRKFPWDDKECRTELQRALGHVWRIKHANIPLIASMLGAFQSIYPDFVVALIDGLLEDIRHFMETNLIKNNQRLLMSVRFLGELFNYSVIEFDLLMVTLHLLVSFGHRGLVRISSPSSIDPPTNHLRIRLVCELLQTCATYFNSDREKRDHLINFNYIFHYYMATKSRLPLDIEYLLDDTFEALSLKRSSLHLEDAMKRLVEHSNLQLAFLYQDLENEADDEEEKGGSQERDEEDMTGGFRSNKGAVEEFDRALTGMVTSGLEERKLERRVAVFDVPIPLSLLSPRSSQANGASSSPLKMLLKKGRNKTITKELGVNTDQVPFMQNALQERAKDAVVEAQNIKDFVLRSQSETFEGTDSPQLSTMRKTKGKTTFSLYGRRHDG